MIKQILIITLSYFITVNIFAQQNFFNVPSSDITDKNKFFFQQQINLYLTNIASNSTLCYGLGSKYEIGLNILGITYDKEKRYLVSSSVHEQPVFPSMGINAQKEIFGYKKYALTLGGQWLFPSRLTHSEWYLYLNNKMEIRNFHLIAGLYSGNYNYFGTETKFVRDVTWIGLQLGIEYPLIRDKLFIQSDFISGKTAMSNLIFGAAYKINKKWIFSTGYQIANSKNTSSSGLIFELTYIQ